MRTPSFKGAFAASVYHQLCRAPQARTKNWKTLTDQGSVVAAPPLDSLDSLLYGEQKANQWFSGGH